MQSEEIVHCDLCGGLILGPRDYDVALCHCLRPKSHGRMKQVRGRHRPDTFSGSDEHPRQLDRPVETLSWDTLPPVEK